MMQHMERKHNRTDLVKAGLVEQLERQRAVGSDGDLLKIEAEVEDGGKLEGAVIS